MTWPFALLALNLTSTLFAQQFNWPTRQVTATAVGAPLPGEFTQIVGAVLWPDGRVLVAEGSTSQLTLYGANNRVVWAVGRQGSGPGEYRSITAIVPCRNGLVGVYDRGNLRVTMLSPDSGRVLGSRPDKPGNRGDVIWCQDEGRDFVSNIPIRTPEPPQLRTIFSITTELRTLSGVEGTALATGTSEYFMGSGAYSDRPFGEMAIATGGGSVVYLCQTVAGTCTATDLTRNATHTFSLALPRSPLSRAQWKRALDERLAMVVGLPARARDQLAQVYEEMPKPDRIGSIDLVRADTRGRLWVRTYQGYGQATRTWLVVTPQGVAIATVQLPANAEPLGIGLNQLIARVVDSDGVPTVQRFAFSGL